MVHAQGHAVEKIRTIAALHELRLATCTSSAKVFSVLSSLSPSLGGLRS